MVTELDMVFFPRSPIHIRVSSTKRRPHITTEDRAEHAATASVLAVCSVQDTVPAQHIFIHTRIQEA